MPDSDDKRSPTERLPAALIEELDTLESPELHAVREYVDQLLESSQPPIEEQIREEATGEVIDIEDEGIYTLVKHRPPNHGEGDSKPVSLYHVTRERHPDGEETLHWAFLGDVHDEG
ncbi:hypothetical protein [Natrinema halophilum]|uniref:Uncharacterized protein n=1 Tax=Natrinema halophilum TaxID=1699371 RepID=A0A7D5H9N2_9EURY|nr:hypothetical protein [Natrinema halophilum]QLG50315.1 hypothetical protein HYG82_16435 [Natrinema halophilum]